MSILGVFIWFLDGKWKVNSKLKAASVEREVHLVCFSFSEAIFHWTHCHWISCCKGWHWEQQAFWRHHNLFINFPKRSHAGDGFFVLDTFPSFFCFFYQRFIVLLNRVFTMGSNGWWADAATACLWPKMQSLLRAVWTQCSGGRTYTLVIWVCCRTYYYYYYTVHCCRRKPIWSELEICPELLVQYSRPDKLKDNFHVNVFPPSLLNRVFPNWKLCLQVYKTL